MSGQRGQNGPNKEATLGMESVNRLAKIPVVENTINLATDIYGKVKDSNSTLNSLLGAAEGRVKQAVELAHPVAEKLEGPIRKVDSVICSGLDYVGANIPSINLPSAEVLENTKNLVRGTVEPAIKCVSAVGELGASKIASMANLRPSSPCPNQCCIHKEDPARCPSLKTPPPKKSESF